MFVTFTTDDSEVKSGFTIRYSLGKTVSSKQEWNLTY